MQSEKIEFEYCKLGDDIPKVSCVYLLMNGNELNYVGETINLRYRMSDHRRKITEWNEIFESIWYLSIEDDTKRKEMERRLILEFEPKWNYNTTPFTKPVPKPYTCR